jgi:hypothetical protein
MTENGIRSLLSAAKGGVLSAICIASPDPPISRASLLHMPLYLLLEFIRMFHAHEMDLPG